MADYAPLAGIRVIELGNYIAAPTAGRLLADFGAEVIKVERPHTGDEIRRWRVEAGQTSLLYRTINRNKKSIVLDLRSETGRQVVKDLVATADVLLENFRPGTLERWGLGPDVLNEINPSLIITRVSAFGQTGPLADRPGFAAVAEAISGFRELVGDPDRPPVRVGISIGDSIAGLYAAFGVVMSLYQRESTPAPVALPQRIIDVALNEAMFSMMESLVPDYDASGVLRTRTGGRIQGIAPSNAYVCADGRSVVIAGNADNIFVRYMQLIGRPDLAADPGLIDNASRWGRREELDAAISEWTSQRTAEQALRELDHAGVPAGPVYTAADILTDEQYAARDMIQRRPVELTDGELREIAFPGIVPVVGERSLPIRTVGPDLGADTRDVLCTLLNYTPEQIEAVVAETETS